MEGDANVEAKSGLQAAQFSAGFRVGAQDLSESVRLPVGASLLIEEPPLF